MHITKRLGIILLSVWLILMGLLPLLKIGVSEVLSVLMCILAIAAGVLLLLDR